MKKNVMIALSVGALVLVTAGIAFASGGRIGKQYVETEAKAEPGDFVEIGSESGNAESDRYIEENPVKKWGHVSSVDQENQQITFLSNEVYTDESGKNVETTQEIILNMAEGVPVIDAATGFPVAWEDINKEQPAYVWTSQAMTMSLPAQTAAQVLVVNVPEDAQAPLYVVVKELEKMEDGSLTIVDQDGSRWNVAADTSIIPYLTRNMVTLDALEVGSKCMIVPGKAVGLSLPPVYTAEQITLFAW